MDLEGTDGRERGEVISISYKHVHFLIVLPGSTDSLAEHNYVDLCSTCVGMSIRMILLLRNKVLSLPLLFPT